MADQTSRSAPVRPRRADLATPSLPARRFAWVRELILVIGFYNVYQVVRGQADVGARARAFRNARWVVEAERFVHVFVEHSLQSAALGARWLITFANTYYGTVHFIATGGILLWLFFRRHHHYRKMRNTLAATTLLGLVTFLSFPLAPPRMLPCNNSIPAPGQGPFTLGECFVDTLHTAGGVWSYESPVAKAIANQFAAMPSLHFGWSLWCATALFIHARSRTTRVLGIVHSTITLFAIVVTANHYLLDAVGGALVFVAGWFIASVLERRSAEPGHDRPTGATVD
ncbi:MAG: phosphatase PAP2 family protein [Ilumatobacteraceae bacterium]